MQRADAVFSDSWLNKGQQGLRIWYHISRVQAWPAGLDIMQKYGIVKQISLTTAK
jgi:hypothetical protein